MAQANVLQTYGDQNIVTDIVRDSIEIISAKEDGIYAMLGKTKALAMIHSYENDTLATPGSLATEQGQNWTYNARTTPTLLTNLVEEISNPIQVTRPQIAVQHFSGTNELDRQLAKGMSEWTNAVEYDLVRSTLVSGTSGTVQKMSGIIQAISQALNYTSQTSGTVFAASILDSLMQNCWTNSNGDVATDVFVGGSMKKIFDGFINKTNVVVNSPDIKDIVKTVTTYETSMGTITLHKHRYVQAAADPTNRLLAIRPDKLKVAFLESPTIIDAAITGPFIPRVIYGSLTLETHNQLSNFYCDGFLIS